MLLCIATYNREGYWEKQDIQGRFRLWHIIDIILFGFPSIIRIYSKVNKKHSSAADIDEYVNKKHIEYQEKTDKGQIQLTFEFK